MPNIPSYGEQQVKPVEPRFNPLSGAGRTPEAFGSGLAEETKRFGGVMEQNASRWEQQAQALQTQDNEASANELTTQYLIQQAKITEEFKQLQGKDPQAAMDKYTKDLSELRATLRGNVPNAEVGRMFDRETQRQFGYAVMNGSSYAATQLRQYRTAQQKAVIDNTTRAAADAANPEIFKASLSDLADKIRNSNELKGQSPEVIDAQIRTEQGKAWGVWLKDIAEKDPTAARKILKDNRAGIDGIVAQGLENVINTQTVAKIGDRLVNDSILGGATETKAQKIDYAMSVLTSKYGKAGAAAIIGGMDRGESGLDTNARNRGDGRDGSDSIGIGQWNAERAKALLAFAQKRGQDPYDFKTQIAFIDFELSGSHKSVGDKLKATDDPVQAARIATGEYEVAGGTIRGNPDGVPNLSARIAGTRDLYGRVVSPVSSLGNTPGQRQALENSVRKSAEDYAQANGLDQTTRDALVKTSINKLDTAYAKQVATQRDSQLGNRNALQLFVNGGDDGKGIVTSLDEITGPNAPAAVRDAWYSADAQQRQTIQDRIKRNAAAELSPSVPTSETIAASKRLHGQMVDDPDGFVAVDLDKEKLTRSDLRTLISAQDKIRTGRVTADEMATSKRSVDQAVGVMRSNGLLDLNGFRKDDPDVAGKMGALRGALVQELDAFNLNPKHQGQKPTEKELLEIGRKIIREEVNPTYLFGLLGGGTTKRFDPKAAAPAVVNYDDIPKDKIEQMRQFYARTGKPATRQQYRLDYQKWLDRQTSAGAQ